jgi:hypothetical protein
MLFGGMRLSIYRCIRTLTSDLQDLAQPCTRLCESSASPLATYVMISWQVRAFSQPSCPAITRAATIFDMYKSAIDMVKQQKLIQSDMSSVSHKKKKKHAFGGARWCMVKTWEILYQSSDVFTICCHPLSHVCTGSSWPDCLGIGGKGRGYCIFQI